jgi:hypothetical protein
MKHIISIIILLSSAIAFAQNEFHVFPLDGKTIAGTPNGNGSIDNPWDLQTALSQSPEYVNGGDTIWIHEGVYNGRFMSLIRSSNSKFITVSAFKDDTVILDGNVSTEGKYVLEVKGGKVIFRNFEVTYLGDFPRLYSDKNIRGANGINHISGECKFQNLKIYNIPGLGFGSWKSTGGSVIEDCIIYNNGIIGKKRGFGEGMYVQNHSDNTRIIRNNIIFNNYYKGVEIWSASSGQNKEFVKNIALSGNVIFNNGIPSGRHQGNVIIASNDRESVNIAKHIKVENNVLYHNVDFIKNNKLGDASSLLLGFIKQALVEDITVTDNVIIGQNNAFSILHAKSVLFKNNTVYTGYVHFDRSTLPGLESQLIQMDHNNYFSKRGVPFRISKHKDYTLTDWQNTFKIDTHSSAGALKDFEINSVLKVSPLHTKPSHFNVVLLEKNGNDVEVNFSDYNIEEGMTYKIYDIENSHKVLKSGKITKTLKVSFPMNLTNFEKPLHNTLAIKSADNFGVFRIEFEKSEKKSFFKRLFGWLF